jgi:hypothetical protein
MKTSGYEFFKGHGWQWGGHFARQDPQMNP